jgi:oxalate decarboxylase/phosphoglucose isomerase-like protein (cupin superfamily)
MKTYFVIKDKTAGSHNGITKEYIDEKGNGTSLLENAKFYETFAEAQKVIEDNSIENEDPFKILWNEWAYVSEEEI